MSPSRKPFLTHIAPGLRQLAIPIDKVSLDPANARLHPEKNLAAIESSLKRFGQRMPIVVQKQGMVVRAGNGRVTAARKLGWTHIAAVVVDESNVDAVAFAIADNRTAELAEWDEEALAKLLRTIEGTVDAAELGFSDLDIEELMRGVKFEEEEARETEAVEPPSRDPDAKAGDLWILGDHRVVCGDATREKDVRLAFGGQPHSLMVTDPPYGVEYDATWRHGAGISASKQTGKVSNDDRASWASAFRHFGGQVAYVWHAACFSSSVERSLQVVGFEIRSQIIWVKRRFVISRGHYHWRHEPCWYAARKGETVSWAGGRKKDTVWADIVDSMPHKDLFATKIDEETVLAFPGAATTVWEIGHDKAAGGGHSTQKPVECMARPMRNHGQRGDVVFDPFLGSGTSVIAAEETSRKCVGLEINPAYVDAIVARWEKHTGKKATREST